ncbi:hypothetical protein NUSPORA_00866 [Nucleospora cyclopteri]
MIPILYASQTGNCQFLSKDLHQKYKNSTFILQLDNFDMSKINRFPFIIFIVSTHGDGQPPFNGSEFYDKLEKLEEFIKDKSLFTFSYTLLALGDSSYSKFCKFGKKLDGLLKNFGAVNFTDEIITADSMNKNGFYDGYEKLLEEVKKIHLNGNFTQNNDDFDSFKVLPKKYNAKIIRNTLLTKELMKNLTKIRKDEIYEIVLEVENAPEFLPGDCIGILPANSIEIKFIETYFGEEALVFYKNIDLFSIPHWKIFTILAGETENPLYKEKLIEISNDYDLYYEYVLEPKRNLFDILGDFNIKKINNIAGVKKYLNTINFRYFSVSKCKKSNQYSILYNIPERKKGLCTSFLKNRNCGDTLEIIFTSSKLYLEGNKMLFLCTGTGFTLPRSAIEYFGKEKEILVFYGHRYEKSDDLNYLTVNDSRVISVASREGEKSYIQKKFKDFSLDIGNIEDWLIFVSGNCRLNKEIRKILQIKYGKKINFQSETW